jgi:hypothetical protein
MLYGCESWSLIADIERRMQVYFKINDIEIFSKLRAHNSIPMTEIKSLNTLENRTITHCDKAS